MTEDKLKYQKEIGSRIREARNELGISIDALAERVEISSTFLSIIERGIRGTTAQRLNTFAKVLGVSPNYLLQGETDYNLSKKDKLLQRLQNCITEENSDMYNKVLAQLSGYNL